MTRNRHRVAELAAFADVDLDEALVTLWDAGIDVNEPSDFIPRESMASARRALGLDDPRAMMQVDYWLDVTGLKEVEFRERAASLGVIIGSGARRLPKNSLRRIRQHFAASARASAARLAFPEPEPLPEFKPLDWVTIGHTPIRSFLEVDELLAIHEALTADFENTGDPISPPGVKDLNLLDSAAHRPRTSWGDALKYESAEMAGAALFHSLVLNHAFHNGNKRTGLVSLLAFLDRNGLVMTCTEDELFKMTLRVAQHGLEHPSAPDLADRETHALAQWVRRNTRPIEHGERPMKWVDLQRVLASHGCTCEMASGKGNRMNITRVVSARGTFRVRKRTLSTQMACSGPGAEAPKNTLHKIRKELELDDEHDVDSATFYRGAEVDAFIIEYRRILRRLARL